MNLLPTQLRPCLVAVCVVALAAASPVADREELLAYREMLGLAPPELVRSRSEAGDATGDSR